MSSFDFNDERHLRAHCKATPDVAIELFAPALVAERHRPVTVTWVELDPLPGVAYPDADRFDGAIRCTWSCPPEIMVLLSEHHPRRHPLDLKHMAAQAANLRARYGLSVYPIVVVTDPFHWDAPESLDEVVDGLVVTTFRPSVVRCGPTDIPMLRGMADADDARIQAWLKRHAARRNRHEMQWWFPLICQMAQLDFDKNPGDRERFLEHPEMKTIIDEIREDGRDDGLAMAAKATVDALHRLVARQAIPAKTAGVIVAELVSSVGPEKPINQRKFRQVHRVDA